jgi:hypothetical protein
MATAPQNAQLRVRKSFVRSSCPLYRHHAVAIAVNQEGWRSYFAQTFREIGFQPAPPYLALAKRAERSARWSQTILRNPERSARRLRRKSV